MTTFDDLRGATYANTSRRFLPGARRPTWPRLLRGSKLVLSFASAFLRVKQRHGRLHDHLDAACAMRKKTENDDRWIAGMAKIQAKMRESYGK
jgi:hypothetical protein